MVNKCWKKVSPKYIAPKEVYRFQNKNSNWDAVSISERKGSKGADKPMFRKKHYGVYIESAVPLGGNLDKTNFFPDRSKALSFAKRYMKKSC